MLQDIPEITYPAPVGDDLIDTDMMDSFSPDDDSEQAKFSRRFKEFVDELEPLSFPLYPIDGVAGSTGENTEASLPLLIFWSRQPHPFQLSRMTGNKIDSVTETSKNNAYTVKPL